MVESLQIPRDLIDYENILITVEMNEDNTVATYKQIFYGNNINAVFVFDTEQNTITNENEIYYINLNSDELVEDGNETVFIDNNQNAHKLTTNISTGNGTKIFFLSTKKTTDSIEIDKIYYVDNIINYENNIIRVNNLRENINTTDPTRLLNKRKGIKNVDTITPVIQDSNVFTQLPGKLIEKSKFGVGKIIEQINNITPLFNSVYIGGNSIINDNDKKMYGGETSAERLLRQQNAAKIIKDRKENNEQQQKEKKRLEEIKQSSLKIATKTSFSSTQKQPQKLTKPHSLTQKQQQPNISTQSTIKNMNLSEEEVNKILASAEKNDILMKNFTDIATNFINVTNKIIYNATLFKINALTPTNFLNLTTYNQINNPIFIDSKSNPDTNNQLQTSFLNLLYINWNDKNQIEDKDPENEDNTTNPNKIIIDKIKYYLKILNKTENVDTNNYAIIIDEKFNEDFTNVFDMVHIIVVIELLQYFINNYRLLQTESYFDEIIEYLYRLIYYQTKTIKKNISNINILFNRNNLHIRKKLNYLLNEENSNKIITYVKLNNFDLTDYNKRFNISLNKELINDRTISNEINIQYNNDNYPYYIKENEKYVTKQLYNLIQQLSSVQPNKFIDKNIRDVKINLKQILQNNIMVNSFVNKNLHNDTNINKNRFTFTERKDKNNNTNNILENVKYDSNYLFGKFQEIFLPNISNKEIAETMQNIIDQMINNNKILFLLGYGASGSGKTSSLVYFNNPKTPNSAENMGVLVHLCNKLGNRGYNTINLIVKEYYITETDNNQNDNVILTNTNKVMGIENPIVIESTNFTFKYNGDNDKPDFILENPHTYVPIHRYRTNRTGTSVPQNPFTTPEPSSDTQKPIAPKVKPTNITPSLGKVIQYLIDTDRLVKATTNNPSSSRSHSLGFIEAIPDNDNKPVYIVLGDFAGVENVFKCDEANVINNFLNIKRENQNEAYYDTEIQDIADVFNQPIVKSANSEHYSEEKIIECLTQINTTENAATKKSIIDTISNFANTNEYNFEIIIASISMYLRTNTEKKQNKNIKTIRDLSEQINDKFDNEEEDGEGGGGGEGGGEGGGGGGGGGKGGGGGEENVEDINDDLEKEKNVRELEVDKILNKTNILLELQNKKINNETLKNVLDKIDENLDKQLSADSKTTKTKELKNIFKKAQDVVRERTKREISKLYLRNLDPATNIPSTENNKIEDCKLEYIIANKYPFFNFENPTYRDYLTENITRIINKRLPRNNILDELIANQQKMLFYIIKHMFNIEKINNNNLYKQLLTNKELKSFKNIKNDLTQIIYVEKKIYEEPKPTRSKQSIVFINKNIGELKKQLTQNIDNYKKEISIIKKRTEGGVQETINNRELIADYNRKLLITENTLKDLKPLNNNDTIEYGIIEHSTINSVDNINVLVYFEQLKKTITIRNIFTRTNTNQFYKNNLFNWLVKILCMKLLYLPEDNDSFNINDDLSNYIKKYTEQINSIKTNMQDFKNNYDKTTSGSTNRNKIVHEMVKTIKNENHTYLYDNLSSLKQILIKPYPQEKIESIENLFTEINNISYSNNLFNEINNIKVIAYCILNNYQNNTKYTFYKLTDNYNPNSKILPIKYNVNIKEIQDIINPEYFSTFDPINKIIEYSGSLNISNNEENTENNFYYYISQNRPLIKTLIKILKKIIKYVYDIIKETRCRLLYGQAICNNRKFEGEFINDSLYKIGETINEILATKSSNVIYNSPDFIDVCLKQYCPSNTNCFSIKTAPNLNKPIPSVIFQQIFDYFNNNRKPNYTKTQFYNDIIVSVFCVFNISKSANNPPPVPYIDINNLKLIFNNKLDKTTDIKPILKEIVDSLQYFEDKVVLDSNIVYNINHIIANTEQITNEYLNTAFTTGDYALYNNYIKEFINAIDKNNAASAIGTLEFVDKIAKFNTVNNICYATIDDKNKTNDIVEKEIISYSNGFTTLNDLLLIPQPRK